MRRFLRYMYNIYICIWCICIYVYEYIYIMCIHTYICIYVHIYIYISDGSEGVAHWYGACLLCRRSCFSPSINCMWWQIPTVLALGKWVSIGDENGKVIPGCMVSLRINWEKNEKKPSHSIFNFDLATFYEQTFLYTKF